MELSPTDNVSNSTGHRAAAKSRGIDIELSRRVREERSFQLRKEKRIERTHTERRKSKVDKSDVQQDSTQTRFLSLLDEKSELLQSSSPRDQLKGVNYFRRLLAGDKNPPLDAVLSHPTVLPTLITFLSKTASPIIQHEVVWCLTNIACGDAKHVRLLVELDIVRMLLTLYATSANGKVKEQALWAISNLSADDNAQSKILEYHESFGLVMREIGLQCYYSTVVPEVHTPSFTPLKPSSEGRIVREDIVECPSLCTMRHITRLCTNIARRKAELAPFEYKQITFMLSELIQSPDEDVTINICDCLLSLVEYHPNAIQLLAEHGIISKLKEVLEVSNLHEISVLVLCAILRASNALYRRVVLLDPSPRGLPLEPSITRSYEHVQTHPAEHSIVLKSMVELLNTTSIAVNRQELCKGIYNAVLLSPRYAVLCVSFHIVDGISAAVNSNVYDVMVNAGYCLCEILQAVGSVLDTSFMKACISILWRLLAVSDSLLLVSSLRTIQQIVVCAGAIGLYLEELSIICDKLTLLTVHPFAEIADAAAQLECSIRRYDNKLSAMSNEPVDDAS